MEPDSLDRPEGTGGEESKGLVLAVDDEPTLLRLYERVLGARGYRVKTAPTGAAASALLGSFDFDMVVSDISMPDMDGLELLKAVREHDLDVPVVLITGSPTLETAVKAVELGALRYITKPIDISHLEEVVERAVQLNRIARAKRMALAVVEGERSSKARTTLAAQFEQALATLVMHFQPIVSFEEQRLYGYEALVRSHELSLPDPMALFDAAERLGREQELARLIRGLVAETLSSLSNPPEFSLFVNIHPLDLLDEELANPNAPLSRFAQKVVLEVTERASLERVPDVRSRAERLRRLGYRIAIDDLGAGYAGLSSFAQLEPEIVKLDMSLVRDAHEDLTKRRLIRSMVKVCNEMNLLVVAEGIERSEERDTLLELGCHLLQGYLFARPGLPFPVISW